VRAAPGAGLILWHGEQVIHRWSPRGAVLFFRSLLGRERGLPQAHLVWLPGCGHVPINDAPDLVAEVIVGGQVARHRLR
jgi:pimeloyl-ACP methyl ester carboxylesterase